ACLVDPSLDVALQAEVLGPDAPHVTPEKPAIHRIPVVWIVTRRALDTGPGQRRSRGDVAEAIVVEETNAEGRGVGLPVAEGDGGPGPNAVVGAPGLPEWVGHRHGVVAGEVATPADGGGVTR